MQPLKFILVSTILLMFSLNSAFSQSIEAGAKIANELCARCHDVSADGGFKQYPPSFAAIAVYRSGEYIFSRILYSPIHSGMPQMTSLLTRDDVNDVLFYIVSLEKK